MWKWNPSLLVLFFFGLFFCIQEHQAQADQLHFQSVVEEGYLSKEAAFWGLTQLDYERYEKILESDFVKLWWKDLDPPHLLGLMSNTLEEIQKFALIAVRLDFQRTERELRFQKAYSQAFKSLYPNLQPIDLLELSE